MCLFDRIKIYHFIEKASWLRYTIIPTTNVQCLSRQFAGALTLFSSAPPSPDIMMT